MIQIFAYIFYLVICIYITVIVGWKLYEHGQIYTCRIFETKELNQYVNKMLLIGYYLLNIGYALFVLIYIPNVTSISGLIEVVTKHAGMNILGLAFMHYFNLGWLYLYQKLKNKKEVLTKK